MELCLADLKPCGDTQSVIAKILQELIDVSSLGILRLNKLFLNDQRHVSSLISLFSTNRRLRSITLSNCQLQLHDLAKLVDLIHDQQ